MKFDSITKTEWAEFFKNFDVELGAEFDAGLEKPQNGYCPSLDDFPTECRKVHAKIKDKQVGIRHRSVLNIPNTHDSISLTMHAIADEHRYIAETDGMRTKLECDRCHLQNLDENGNFVRPEVCKEEEMLMAQ